MRLARGLAALLVAGLLAGCSPPGRSPDPPGDTPATATPAADASEEAARSDGTPSEAATHSEEAPTGAAAERTPALGRRRPAWLGTRVLPRTAAGYGEVRPTPAVLRRRMFPTVDVLPPPADNRFAAAIRPVPQAVVRRSTWSPRCPVDRGDLRYVTVVFLGFDDRPHTGELLVNAGAARDIVRVFRTLYRQRFPIEEMRVVDADELHLPPTGDGNNTTAFVCRPSRGSSSWSQHAYGLAVDVNPFFNPYVRGNVVLPELASYFTDRTRDHPGMHHADGPSVQAFAAVGWQWGGSWQGLSDFMHFSANGR